MLQLTAQFNSTDYRKPSTSGKYIEIFEMTMLASLHLRKQSIAKRTLKRKPKNLKRTEEYRT